MLHLSRLGADLASVAPDFERALAGQSREAPVIFKHAGAYFLLTSGCTGWEPNRAEVFHATCAKPYPSRCVSPALARRSRKRLCATGPSLYLW